MTPLRPIMRIERSRRVSGVGLAIVDAGTLADDVAGDAVIVVEVPEDGLADYEWIEKGKPYREWLVPAEVLNRSGRPRLLSEAIAEALRPVLKRQRPTGRPPSPEETRAAVRRVLSRAAPPPPPDPLTGRVVTETGLSGRAGQGRLEGFVAFVVALPCSDWRIEALGDLLAEGDLFTGPGTRTALARAGNEWPVDADALLAELLDLEGEDRDCGDVRLS
ncbi:MAG: hypothetical protein LC733_05040 [Actinobacteria bacterium]|nr:hypothetical protein [Actinomycetota bacterium]